MRSYDLTEWTDADLKRGFRGVLVAYILLRVASYFVPVGPIKNEQSDWLWLSRDDPSLFGEYVGSNMYFFHNALLMYEVVALLGLLMMHPWARPFYTVNIILWGFFTFFSGWHASAGSVTVLSYVATLLNGAILVLIYTSPIRDVMDLIHELPEVAVDEQDSNAIEDRNNAQ